jgi:hypothetical protein
MEVTMQAKQAIAVQKQRQNNGQFKKGNTKGFKPGQSGNPGGLPKGTPKVSLALMRLLRSDPGEVFTPKSRAEEIAYALYRRAATGDVSAIRELSGRTEGKSPATVNLNADDKALRYQQLAEKLAAQYDKPLEEVVSDIIEREPQTAAYFEGWVM